jgi:hypothetical protein
MKAKANLRISSRLISHGYYSIMVLGVERMPADEGYCCFQACAVCGSMLFVVFISDFRKKKDMVPLIGERWTYLLKASYLVPLAAYVHVLFAMNWISAFDVLALDLTSLGAATQAMRWHRRGAPTQQMLPRRRNPKGRCSKSQGETLGQR